MRFITSIVLCLISVVAVAAPDGQLLYATHCAACHGDSGHGGVGVPLALPSFLDSVDDRFLAVTIRRGRPGRVMPAFNELGDAEVNAIVAFIRSWSDNPAPVYEQSRISGDPVRGKALYASHCAACHGADGRGGTGTGVTFSRKRDLPIIAPGLNNPGFLAAASDELIRYTLQQGREGTPMTSLLADGLDEQDISDLVSYIRAFESSTDVTRDKQSDDKVIVMTSPYSLDETVENLKDAIVSQNFILIRQDLLEHGLFPEEDQDSKQVILHFCNFRLLFDALAVDPRVGLFLPCRVTVTETERGVEVSTINPGYLSRLFNNDELDMYCDRMHGVYMSIMEDATL